MSIILFRFRYNQIEDLLVLHNYMEAKTRYEPSIFITIQR